MPVPSSEKERFFSGKGNKSGDGKGEGKRLGIRVRAHKGRKGGNCHSTVLTAKGGVDKGEGEKQALPKSILCNAGKKGERGCPILREKKGREEKMRYISYGDREKRGGGRIH